ncbi:hypothetical protein BD560DRAFT_425279 [Blakeslea trispora]|nr:hypothetical protein BD560DRAFT_425279 [Blakeslea trispora]
MTFLLRINQIASFMDHLKNSMPTILKASGIVLLNTLAGVIFLHAMLSEKDYLEAKTEPKQYRERKLQLKAERLELEKEKLKHAQDLLKIQADLLAESKKIVASFRQMQVSQRDVYHMM